MLPVLWVTAGVFLSVALALCASACWSFTIWHDGLTWAVLVTMASVAGALSLLFGMVWVVVLLTKSV